MSPTQTESDWRELFRDAVRSWNSTSGVTRLEEACHAIRYRLHEQSKFVPLEKSERGELNDALYFLGLLSMATEARIDNGTRGARPARRLGGTA